MKLDEPLNNFLLIGSSFAPRPDPDGSGEETLADAYVWFDWDSYRWLDVLHKRENEIDWEDPDERVQVEWLGGTTRLLRPLLDTPPPDVLALDIGPSGEVLWTSTDNKYNGASCTYYPSVEEYGLPASASNLPVLLRSDLTELERLDGTVTKVSYRCPVSGKEKIGVFKARANCPPYGGVWDEIQIMARVQPHPFILPIDALVLEELTGLGVVGFITPFVSASSLDKPLPGPFKLRWLRELMSLVDELNLEYGIVHQDILPQNLFINPNTDSILLFDFNAAAGIGKLASKKRNHSNLAHPELNDVKGVAFLLYSIITRDPTYRSIRFDHISDNEFNDLTKWTKHPDVRLDTELTTFHHELTSWMRKRRSASPQPNHNHHPHHPESQPPQQKQISIPTPPQPPTDKTPQGWDAIGTSIPIRSRLEAGRPVLCWQRPPRDRVDRGRRLLATGRYAGEECEEVGVEGGMGEVAVDVDVDVSDLRRGFPQPASPPSPSPSGGRVTRAGLRGVVRGM